MNRMKRKKKIIIEESNCSHLNWAAAYDFDIFDERGNLLLSGTFEYDTVTTEVIDTYDEDGNFVGIYQESGDFSVGYTNYNILDTFKVTVNCKYAAYFPHAAVKEVLKYFETDSISFNW